jgi:antitoxin component of MazEF toxin-antitoxin module
MMIVIKSVEEDTISLPIELMTSLHLAEGDAIKAILEGETLRLARLDSFLALRGTLADDEAFDEAISLLEQGWQSWPVLDSA